MAERPPPGPGRHLWINDTGCAWLHSVAADATTVHAGGHQRWAGDPSAATVRIPVPSICFLPSG